MKIVTLQNDIFNKFRIMENSEFLENEKKENMRFSDDILNGLCCQNCGKYFVYAHGRTVICHNCYEEKERRGEVIHYPKAVNGLF